MSAWLVVAVLVIAQVGMGISQAAPQDPTPIAKIRLLRGIVHVGDRVGLAADGANDSQAHFQWRLLRRPMTSGAKISDKNQIEADFLADVPGIYVVELTVKVRSLSATATLTATVTESNPLVAVNTIDNVNGQPGVTVGSQFYQGSSTQIYAVVLDRNSLEATHPNYYSLTSSGIAQLASDWKNLPTDGSVLVLAALAASAGPAPPQGPIPSSLVASLNAALNEIGAFLPARWELGPLPQVEQCWSSNTPACEFNSASWGGGLGTTSSFSVIGVPGMTVGKAWYDDALQRGTTNGPLVGYLTPGVTVNGLANANAYSFVFGADQYVLVDSCVSGAPSACVISVGDQIFAPQAGVNGMNVVLLNRVTLTPFAHQTVTSTTALNNLLTQNPPPTILNVHFFSTPQSLFSDGVIAVVQSVGNGTLTYDAATPLLQTIDQLGGTPETFGPAITQGKPYALVGVASNLPWHGTGIESSPVISPYESGHARGVLARDRLARYTPAANDPVGTSNLALFPIVYEDPQPWPYAGNCALQYFADEMSVPDYPDIRSGYPDTSIAWGQYPQDPFQVSYPTSPPSYCTPFPSQTDFENIQSELASEFAWVTNVRTLINNLSSPFTVTQGSTTNEVVQAANTVYNSVNPPSQANTSLEWLGVFAGLADAGSYLAEGPAAAAFGLVAASGSIATDVMSSSPTANPAKQVIATAINLSGQLQDQLLAHLGALGRLQTILVSDYGKLYAVGPNVDTPAYEWDGMTTTINVADALNATTQQQVYSALLPPTWFGYNLKPDLKHQFSSSDVSKFGCGFNDQNGNTGVTLTFWNQADRTVAANEFQALIQLVPGVETSTTEVWTFGTVNGNFTTSGQYANVPKSSLTDTLFSTSGAAAYPPAWWRSTYNPPSYVVCNNVFGSTDSRQGHPSAIPPAAAAYGQQ